MRGKVIILLTVSIAVSLWALTALPQAEEQKEQLFLIQDVVVKPSMVSEYEAVVKEWTAQFKKHKFPYPCAAYSTNDFHYYFLNPIKNYADVDNWEKAWDELGKKMGKEQSQALMKLFDDTWEYTKFATYYQVPELSYTPEKPRLKPEETKFTILHFCYIQAGKENEFEKILKEAVALYKSKNIPDGYNIFAGDTGAELPVYVIAEGGKSPSDYYSQAEKNYALLGEEEKALSKKMLAILRKYESKSGWARPDLSYMPEEEKPAK